LFIFDRKGKNMSGKERNKGDNLSGASLEAQLKKANHTTRSGKSKQNADASKPTRRWIAGLLLLSVIGAAGAGLNFFAADAEPEKTRNVSDDRPESALRTNGFVSNPASSPLQPSVEYIYAGDKLLAVEDANASAAPPAELAVWRPSSGTWWVMGGQFSQPATQAWGIAADTPVPADYDGDGKTDFCVFRESNGVWYVIKSSDGSQNYYYFGIGGDRPAAADFDGDGKSDPAIYRPSTGVWYIRQSSDNTIAVQQFGLASDIPVPADYDGDGRADISVWRDASAAFYVLKSTNRQLQHISFGQPGDKPVCGDYDGDGRADAAVRRNTFWYVLQSSNRQTAIYTWGNWNTDKAVQNDFDGDGKLDIAVWRASESAPGAVDVGTWYIRNSSTGQARIERWGVSGDIPVPAFYRR
jgi:hypothetical protein